MASLQQTTATISSSSFRANLAPAASPSRRSSSSLSFAGSAAFPTLRRALPPPSRRGGGARMAGSTVASTYAQALADVAQSGGTLDETAADVEKLEGIFTDENVFRYITNPVIDVDKKRAVVEELSAAAGMLPTTTNFLNILVETRRIDLIREVAKEFEQAYNQLTETELAVVTSVVPLEPQHLAQIAKQVQKLTGAKNVRIKTDIDPSLVAGFTVRFGSSGSKLIDMSVKKQLEEIAAQLEDTDIKISI